MSAPHGFWNTLFLAGDQEAYFFIPVINFSYVPGQGLFSTPIPVGQGRIM